MRKKEILDSALKEMMEEKAEQPESLREVGQKRKEWLAGKIKNGLGKFRGFGQRLGNIVRSIGRAGGTGFEYALATPEAAQAGAKAVKGGVEATARKGMETGKKAIAWERGLDDKVVGWAMNLDQRSDEWKEKAVDWTKVKSEQTGEWVEEKYAGMKKLVGNGIERIQEKGRDTKEAFMGKVDAIKDWGKEQKTKWAEARQEKDNLKQRRELASRIEEVAASIKQDQETIEQLRVSAEEKENLKSALEQQLAELRGTMELGSEIEAISVEA